jgi:hypothetical protein
VGGRANRSRGDFNDGASDSRVDIKGPRGLIRNMLQKATSLAWRNAKRSTEKNVADNATALATMCCNKAGSHG